MGSVDVYCRDASLAAGEPLAGSAVPEKALWIVCEVATPWGPKGLEDSGLPTAVVDCLSAFVGRHQAARVQLIRKPERVEDTTALYLARSAERGSHVQHLRLSAHGDLLATDLEAFARGETLAGATELTEPLFLVCVHGKRDRCCAQHGMPVYGALASLRPEHTWQTTHLGGHRFAATMLVLPHGVAYGRVQPHEAPAIVAAHARGELYNLERMRGHTMYAAPAQAAEVLLRRQLGLLRLESLKFVGLVPVQGGMRVTFRTECGAEHGVDVAREAVLPLAASCGAAVKEGDSFVALRAGPRA